MAKVSFNKLKCKNNEDIKRVQFSNEEIEIKQYLPIQDKLYLIGQVIMASHEEDGNYANPVKIDVFTSMEILYAYTNITFTEKQKEDVPKLYDMIKSSGLLETIYNNIPQEEINIITKGVFDSIKSFYDYQNSVFGVLEGVKNNYKDLEIDLDKMQDNVTALADTPLVKEILPLLGPT